MRLLTALTLLLSFLFSVPGFGHAADVGHAHVRVVGGTDVADDGGSEHAPAGKICFDCHHGCSHQHPASPARMARVVLPVDWITADYTPEEADFPPTADPSPPYKPPRA